MEGWASSQGPTGDPKNGIQFGKAAQGTKAEAVPDGISRCCLEKAAKEGILFDERGFYLLQLVMDCDDKHSFILFYSKIMFKK